MHDKTPPTAFNCSPYQTLRGESGALIADSIERQRLLIEREETAPGFQIDPIDVDEVGDDCLILNPGDPRRCKTIQMPVEEADALTRDALLESLKTDLRRLICVVSPEARRIGGIDGDYQLLARRAYAEVDRMLMKLEMA